MLSTHVNIALQLIGSLSAADKEAFEKEFTKSFVSQKAKSMPTKIKKINPLDPKILAQEILAKHRAKNIRTQV